ncbi:MAG: HEPN domain-containing protein [Armatimonadetes bacterium]|nr:HEPN domain-containing protein [Armatimonadota bacterium]
MTAEQEALVRRAQDEVELARAALGMHKVFRAASSAYYAMYNVVRALLLGEGLDFSSHGSVIGAFGLHFAKTGRAPTHLHRVLIEAERTRIVADYRPLQEVSEARASQLISHAEEFLALAEQLLGPIPEADEETR